MAWKVVGKSLLVLPDGSFVDIACKEGANVFLAGVSDDMDYFSSKVKEIKELRKSEQLNGDAIFKLTGDLQAFANYISLYADREPFQEKMLPSEIQCWLDYTIEEIMRVTVDRHWIDTGNVSAQRSDLFLSIHSMIKHAVPATLGFESDFFQVLTECIKARKGRGRGLPTEFMCGTIVGIVHQALEASISICQNDPYKVFKKLEATGILEQFLRCMTNVDIEDVHALLATNVLANIERNTRFLNRSFRIGQPCGDVARAILDGRDGSLLGSIEVINRLRTIVSLVDGMDSSRFNNCNYCGRDDESFQVSSKKCGRCKRTLYCSVECQRADWKVHKKYCQPIAHMRTANAITARVALIQNFVKKHGVEIVREMCHACQQYRVEIEEMVMELDFMPEKDGTAPALQESPYIKIAPLQRYIDGIEQPDRLYGCNDPEAEDKTKEQIISLLTPRKSETSSTGWVLVNFPDMPGWACLANPLTKGYYDQICRLAREEGLLVD